MGAGIVTATAGDTTNLFSQREVALRIADIVIEGRFDQAKDKTSLIDQEAGVDWSWGDSRTIWGRLSEAIHESDWDQAGRDALLLVNQCRFEDRAAYWRGPGRDAGEAATAGHMAYLRLFRQNIGIKLPLSDDALKRRQEDLFNVIDACYLAPAPANLPVTHQSPAGRQELFEMLMDQQLRCLAITRQYPDIDEDELQQMVINGGGDLELVTNDDRERLTPTLWRFVDAFDSIGTARRGGDDPLRLSGDDDMPG